MSQRKKETIKDLVVGMLDLSTEMMKRKIDKVLDSGAVDIDEWQPDRNPMILPKCIMIALLEDEATQYKATGTSFEKQVNKEVKNIKYFI